MARFELPERGDHWIDLRNEGYSTRGEDVDWLHGAFFYHWPEPGRNIHANAMSVSNIFFNDQWLGKYSQPSFNRLIEQVEGMVPGILEAPASAFTCLTSGGTESIELAVKTARDWARQHRPEVKEPTMVLPRSAHPAFNKSAAFFGLKTVRVRQGNDWRADIAGLEAAITDDTIFIMGSAPSWPHGLIDPIPRIGELAEKYGLWCHVDACVGGFLLPFYKAIGQDLPDWNFDVPGVRSISADLHKFGFTPHGMSSVTFRDEALREHLVFDFDDWPSGRYATESIQGTRPARAAAAAWATMRHLGRDGYLDIARKVKRTTERFVEGIAAIPDIAPLANPEAGLLVITSDKIDMFAVSPAVAHRGFPHGRTQEPESLHFTMNPVEDDQPIDMLLEALEASADDVRAGKITRDSDLASYI
jgi:sphinganine-1-phosphate aldolase